MADPGLTEAMVDEMVALEETTLGILCPYQEGRKLWAANGYLQSNTKLMELLRGIKHDLWLKVTLSLMV